jgi:hypothetical protein
MYLLETDFLRFFSVFTKFSQKHSALVSSVLRLIVVRLRPGEIPFAFQLIKNTIISFKLPNLEIERHSGVCVCNIEACTDSWGTDT